MREKYLTIKNWNTDWKDHPYWEMTEEEQIEYEVYADGVDMRELNFIRTKQGLDILEKEENKQSNRNLSAFSQSSSRVHHAKSLC